MAENNLLLEKSEILQRITEIFIKFLGVDEKDVVNEASLTDDLGADSLDKAELLVEVEKEFEIVIQDKEFHDSETVALIVDLVYEKVNEE